jgi:NAD(P)-dependent dehydrogenase (short-subunit alcohol dehydrogenase family)
MTAYHSCAPDPRWAAPFFTGRRVLVTGGTSGIGAGIAAGFAGAGSYVVATGATDREIDAAKAVDRAGVDFRLLDVRDRTEVDALVSSFERLTSSSIAPASSGAARNLILMSSRQSWIST